MYYAHSIERRRVFHENTADRKSNVENQDDETLVAQHQKIACSSG